MYKSEYKIITLQTSKYCYTSELVSDNMCTYNYYYYYKSEYKIIATKVNI